MGSALTSIGKILSIKFLLIFLSIIAFLDLYYTMILGKEFITHYAEILNFASILKLIVAYLIVINILIPMLGFAISIVFCLISFIPLSDDSKNIISSIFLFLWNKELQELYKIQNKAVEENNSAKMKMFELGLETYKEMHSIYLFSFVNLVLFVVCLIVYPNYDGILLLELYNRLIETDDSKISELSNIFFVYIPIFILLFYSFKYITSFNAHKAEQWIKVNISEIL